MSHVTGHCSDPFGLSLSKPGKGPSTGSGRTERGDSGAIGQSSFADGFADQCERWSLQTGADERLAVTLRQWARALVLALGEGHVCKPLPEVPDVRAALSADLLASGVVRCPEQALPEQAGAPLVLDAGRLYRARDWQTEVSLAACLRERAAAGTLCVISGGPGSGKTSAVARLLGRLLALRPETRLALSAPTGKAAARMMEALASRCGDWPADLQARLPTHASTLHRLLGWHPRQGEARHSAENPLPLDLLVVDEASMLDQEMASRVLSALPLGCRLILLGDKDQLAAVESGAVFAELSAYPGHLPEGSDALDAWMDVVLGLNNPVLPESPVRPELVEGRAPLSRGLRQAQPERLSSQPEGLSLQPEGLSLQPEGLSPELSPSQFPLSGSVACLQGSYRFGADSVLGELASAVRRGEPSEFLQRLDHSSRVEGEVVALWQEAAHALSEAGRARLLAGYAPYYAGVSGFLNGTLGMDALFEALDAFRVLAAIHEGPRGVQALNRLLLGGLREAVSLFWQAAEARWVAGQPVLVLENDPGTGLFNGDVGLVLPEGGGPGAEKPWAAWFPVLEGGYRAVPLSVLPRHDLGFALTIHKAQGSEFERVAVVLPGEVSPVLRRELIYTAITRAQRGLLVLADRAVLSHAIDRPTVRDAGLGGRLFGE